VFGRDGAGPKPGGAGRALRPPTGRAPPAVAAVFDDY